MTNFQNSRRAMVLAWSRHWPLGATLAIFAVAVAVSPLHAADDMSVVGDIPMPQIHMPAVDVNVRVGDEARPLPPPRYYPAVYPRGPYAAMAPVHYEREMIEQPGVQPQQVARMLQSTGFALLGPVNRRGWVYTVAVLNPRGDDGRAVIDVRTGAIIRFVPAMNVSARFDDELTTIYGPPGPPPANAGYDNRRGALLDIQRAPRPATSVPHAAQPALPKVASRTAGPAPAQPSSVKPSVAKSSTTTPPVAATAAVKPANATTAENKSAGTTTGTAPSSASQSAPASATPAETKLWPTQAMPDVQPLD